MNAGIINKQDKIRGSLIGGAAGDALGYAIEFSKENEIFAQYGKDGITEYKLDTFSRKAIVSDDTQMTLFTAEGLLEAKSDSRPHDYVKLAYFDWLLTQNYTYSDYRNGKARSQNGLNSWLLDVPELFSRRAPGGTCLSALSYPKKVDDYLKEPVNDSKGCGGIMRVAPVGLMYNTGISGEADICDVDIEGAYVAAITHGHPLGYMPAAVVAHIISRLVYGPEMPLKDIVIEAKVTCQKIFAGTEYLDYMSDIIDKAMELSENNEADLDNIHALGEGWVAEETLGIALYCALKYKDDFSKALAVSVNHKGDSDSTGAVVGNILGALIGYDAIDKKWKENLELHDEIIKMADNLCQE